MKEKHERTYTCSICNFIAKSVTSIEKHKEEAHSTQHNCMKCKRTFLNENILANHIKTHERNARLEEFNCDSCDFQNTKRKILKDHLEAAPGHKPSQKDYECRNCKKIFNSYYNLMNHRSAEHPAQKMCRYFKLGTCGFKAEDCWYSHEKTSSETENQEKTFNEKEDFQAVTKNLPPDMMVLIKQIIKIASTKSK